MKPGIENVALIVPFELMSAPLWIIATGATVIGTPVIGIPNIGPNPVIVDVLANVRDSCTCAGGFLTESVHRSRVGTLNPNVGLAVSRVKGTPFQS